MCRVLECRRGPETWLLFGRRALNCAIPATGADQDSADPELLAWPYMAHTMGMIWYQGIPGSWMLSIHRSEAQYI